jgi:predicted DNA binding CopG/RHH family protein
MSRKQPPESTRYVPDEAKDSTRSIDLSKMRRASFPELKPSSATISLRIPMWMLHELKRQANQRDVPYQSFIKTILAERLEQRPKSRRAAG